MSRVMKISCATAILLAYAVLAVGAQATPPGFDYSPIGGTDCELELTASFNVNGPDLGDPLNGVGRTPGTGPGQGGKGKAKAGGTNGKIRLKVLSVAVIGGVGEFGGHIYLPDHMLITWEVRVSPPTWHFVTGSMVYALTYNNLTSFHGESLTPFGSSRIGDEMVSVGTNIVAGQRIPPRFRPADIIRSGTPVTFRLMPRVPLQQGHVTVRESVAPFRQATLPYDINNASQECTVVAQ